MKEEEIEKGDCGPPTKPKKDFHFSFQVTYHSQTFPKSHTVKEESFVGEKFRTFPSKTFRMELNCVLSN